MKTIGLDIGTTSVCGVLLDAQTGQLIRSLNRDNDTFLPCAHPWEKQQDPVRLIGILRQVADELIGDGTDIVSIGVTGQMHGIVYLDADGAPLGRLTIWQDGRGDQPYRDGKSYAAWMSDKTGYSLATGYGAVTHYYNTVNGLVPPDARCFCTIHDLAVMALTGRKTPLLNPSDAASLGLYDLEKNAFDEAAIRSLGMDPAVFPPVADGYTVAGETPQGIPVSVAIGDNQASVLGSVAELDTSLLVNVGTGSQISCVLPGAVHRPGMDCRPFVDGKYLLVGSSLCGGRAYAILEKFLREVAQEVSGQPIGSAYKAMDRVMDACTAPTTLRAETTFSGTRQQPEKRGSISQIGIDNFTMAQVCGSVLDGIVEELHGMYRDMDPLLTVKPTSLIGSGNGIRRNNALSARFSAAFGLPLAIPAHTEEAAFGAALFGLVAAGAYPTIAAAQTLISYA